MEAPQPGPPNALKSLSASLVGGGPSPIVSEISQASDPKVNLTGTLEYNPELNVLFSPHVGEENGVCLATFVNPDPTNEKEFETNVLKTRALFNKWEGALGRDVPNPFLEYKPIRRSKDLDRRLFVEAVVPCVPGPGTLKIEEVCRYDPVYLSTECGLELRQFDGAFTLYKVNGQVCILDTRWLA